MKISVIIPVYNVAPYLRECLDSVINQTYTDLQIILVDDGSTDESGAICDQYAAKDSRVEVYHHENKNVGVVLNFGLSVAKGEYIAQVDSDDALHPRMCEILYNEAQKYNADLSVCKWATSRERVNESNVSEYNVTQLDWSKEFAKYYSDIFVYRWNKLYKKELFNGFVYPEGHVYEDEYIHRIAFYCHNTIMINLPLYFYRQREGSFMRTFSEQRVYDSFLAYDDRVAFAKEHNWTESYPFIFSHYCDRARWVWSCLRKFKVGDKSLKEFCRQKVRTFLSENQIKEISLKTRLWLNCLPLYFVYILLIKLYKCATNEVRKVFHFIFR